MTSFADDHSGKMLRAIAVDSRSRIRTAASTGKWSCACLGVALLLASPVHGIMDYLYIPFFGSYRLTIFDVMVVFICGNALINGRFRLASSEKVIFRAALCVIASRVLSLFGAQSMNGEQILSVFRYMETLLLLFVLAGMFESDRCRRYFVGGLVLGTVIETVGDLFILLGAGGEDRGIWLGIENYEIQIFFLVICIFAFASGKTRIVSSVLGLLLIAGIVATETRQALVLAIVLAILIPIFLGKAFLKPILVMFLAAVLGVVALFQLAPQAREATVSRMEQLWTGEGTIGYRLILLEMALAAYIQHPVTGLGSGGFARQQDSLYLEINDAFAPEYEDAYGSLSAHNTVLGTAAETGTIGLIAYFFWAAMVLVTCKRVLQISQTDWNGPERFIVVAALVLFALTLQDWWGKGSFMPFASCLLGLLLGWLRTGQRDSLING